MEYDKAVPQVNWMTKFNSATNCQSRRSLRINKRCVDDYHPRHVLHGQHHIHAPSVLTPVDLPTLIICLTIDNLQELLLFQHSVAPRKIAAFER